jgi:hypothetical protein
VVGRLKKAATHGPLGQSNEPGRTSWDQYLLAILFEQPQEVRNELL